MADEFFLLLNVPKIAHIAARQKFFLAHEREQPFAQDKRRQAGVGFVQQRLLAQEVVLSAVLDRLEKFLIEQRAGQHFGVGVIDNVILE